MSCYCPQRGSKAGKVGSAPHREVQKDSRWGNKMVKKRIPKKDLQVNPNSCYWFTTPGITTRWTPPFPYLSYVIFERPLNLYNYVVFENQYISFWDQLYQISETFCMQNSGHKIREAIEKVWDNFVETKAMLNKRSLWVRKWNKKITKKCED